MAIDFDFKAWIQTHDNADYTITKENENKILLTTEYGEAQIRFTDIEESTIVEFDITSFKDNTSSFYLHFELNDEEYAKQLYDEMVEALLGLKDKKTLRVLLSCSSGLTTYMFAEKLNSTASMLGLDYEFDAVSYTSIFDEEEAYDVILIAPQIGYMYNRIKESLSSKPVFQIPTNIFAQYDALEAIKFIQEELDTFYKEKENKKEYCCACKEYEKRILSIAMVITSNKTKIYYQVQEKCEIIDSNMIVKPSLCIHDLYDIIDTMILKHGSIDIIGIATPGIVKDRKMLKATRGNTVYDIKKEFEDKYNIDVCIYNNANAAAVGFYEEHPEYETVVYHSQPFGFGIGGQGIVSNGKVLRGKNGIAGELGYFINRMQLSNDPNRLIKTHNGAIEIVSRELLPTIAITGPDAVALYSPMTPDLDEVKKELNQFLDEEFLPEFYTIKEPQAYILSGITSMCVDYIEEQN